MSGNPKTDSLSTFLVTQFPATLGNLELNQRLIEIRELEQQNERLRQEREQILIPANCGVAGHFKFQENGGHCMMCQREQQQLTAANADAERLAKAGSDINVCDDHPDAGDRQFEWCNAIIAHEARLKGQS